MEQGLLTRLHIGPAFSSAPESPPAFSSLAVPLIGSLFQTYGILWLTCRTPWGASLTLAGLFRTAASFLLGTLAAHAFAVWVNRRLFPQQVSAPQGLLLFAIWPSVVWLPLLVLLVRENSVLLVLVPPLIVASAVFTLRRWCLGPAGPSAISGDASPIATVFHNQAPPPLLRAIFPALATSVALQAAVAEFARARLLSAGALLAACTLLPVWTYPLELKRFSSGRNTRSSLRAAAPRTLVVFLLLAFALIPYLRSSRFADRLKALLGINRSHLSISAPPKLPHNGPPSGGLYTGVILLTPPLTHHEIARVSPAVRNLSAARTRPILIPFDGAYWYFKQPDQRPRGNAPVLRGDPTVRSIRSTDTQPLSMEAHQHLDTPVSSACCRTLEVAVHNADLTPGAIFVEVILSHTASTEGSTLSLGTLPIPSSLNPNISHNRSPVDEVLTFSIPHRKGLREFDEITVAIKPAADRSRTGAHVAIQYFRLLP